VAVTPSFQGFASGVQQGMAQTLTRAAAAAASDAGSAATAALNGSFDGFDSSATTQMSGDLADAAARAGEEAGDAATAALNSNVGDLDSAATAGITDELTEAATTAGQAAGDAGGEALSTSLSDRMQGLGDQLAGPGAVAGGIVAGAFALGLSSAMDTSAANARITAQLRLTETEAERVGNVAGDVFTAGWGASMDEASQAVGAVITSITDLGEASDEELTDLTEQAFAVAQVLGVDVRDAVSTAGRLVENDLAGSAVEAFDVMAGAASAFPPQMLADIPDAIAEYSEHFQRLGLDAQTAFGMMSQFVANGGRDIDQAADVIHEFSRITFEDTAAASAAFGELGLSAEDMLERIHSGGPDAADALSDTLSALRDLGPGADQSRLAVALFGDMAGESTDALFAMDPATASAAAGLEDVAGAGGDAAAALSDDPGAQFEGALRQLGETLGDAVMPVLTTLGDWAADHPGLFQAVALAIIGAALAVGILTAAIWAINVAMAANPVTWIILGVVAAVIALAAIVTLVIVYWDEIVAATVAAWDWIYSKISGIVQWLVDLFMTWSLPALIAKAWGVIRDATQAAWDWIRDATTTAWQAVSGAVSGAVTAVREAISDAWRRVREATSDAWRTVRESITGAITRAREALNSVGDRFVSIGRDIVRGIVRGVSQSGGLLFGSLRSLASSALDSAMGFLGIGSPSRLFADEVGRWIPAGIEQGIAEGEPGLNRTIDRMVQIPDPPAVRATVPTGAAAVAAPTLQIVAGDRHLRAWLEEMVRTQLGGDVTRLGRAQ
jgi:phage-related minor tail protein